MMMPNWLEEFLQEPDITKSTATSRVETSEAQEAEAWEADDAFGDEQTKPFPNDALGIFETVARARPSDVSDSRWELAIRGLRIFLLAGHGDEAERLGWSKDELYAIPRPWARSDLCGAALLISDKTVVEVTSAAIRIKGSSGSVTSFYRKPAIDYRLAYEAHRKRGQCDNPQADEEAALRAIEVTVRLWLTHHPGCTIEEGKDAVLDAIKSKRKCK
jgi:hypothetical protein